MKRYRKVAAGAVAAMAIAIGSVSLGGAIASAVPGPGGPDPRIDGETVITMTGAAEGVAVRGNLPTDGSTSDPGSAYPSAPPATHTEVKNTFAGIITADEVGGNASLRLYCIDIHTSTYPGIGYDQGSWDASGMPNLGYVARLLNDYYPNTSEPSGSPNDNVKAAAVQAAIWYFTDNFVLAVDSPIRAQTADIVNTVRTQSPLPAPAPPALALAPDSITAALGTAAGPFALVTDAVGGATIAVSGGLMYRDAAATIPLPSGSQLFDGQEFWAIPQPAAVGASVSLAAQGESTMPTGNVFLYDGNTPGVSDAQRLILAESVTLQSETQATALFEAAPAGSLTITKKLVGDGVGSQGSAELRVSCDEGTQRTIRIPAGAAEGTATTITDLTVGTTCAVSEPATGANEQVVVAVDGLRDVLIAAGPNEAVITNTVTRRPSGGKHDNQGSARLAATGAGDNGAGLVAGALLLLLAGSSMFLRRADG